MGILIPQTVFEPIPMGEYTAVITAVSETGGQFGKQLVFEFEIDSGEHTGHSLKGWTSTTFGRKSKLFSWARAAFGQEIPGDYTLDTDHLIGRRVRLGVIVRLKPETGEEFNKIDAVLPLRRTAPSDPVQPPPHKEDNDDIPF